MITDTQNRFIIKYVIITAILFIIAFQFGKMYESQGFDEISLIGGLFLCCVGVGCSIHYDLTQFAITIFGNEYIQQYLEQARMKGMHHDGSTGPYENEDLEGKV